MRPLPPHISVFCASKLPILGMTKVKTCRSGPPTQPWNRWQPCQGGILKKLLSHRRRHGRGIGGNHAKAAFLKKLLTLRRCGRRLAKKVPGLLSGNSESSEACSGATRENMSHNTYVAHSPDTISMHEHDGTGPELAPAPRRQLRPRDAGDRSRLRSARPELVRCRVCRRRFAKEPFACSTPVRLCCGWVYRQS